MGTSSMISFRTGVFPTITTTTIIIIMLSPLISLQLPLLHQGTKNETILPLLLSLHTTVYFYISHIPHPISNHNKNKSCNSIVTYQSTISCPSSLWGSRRVDARATITTTFLLSLLQNLWKSVYSHYYHVNRTITTYNTAIFPWRFPIFSCYLLTPISFLFPDFRTPECTSTSMCTSWMGNTWSQKINRGIREE